MSGILQGLIASISSAAAAVTDTYFNLVTLLLNTTSTNGAQNNTFLDSSTNNFTITRNGNTTQGTFTPFSQTGWSNYFSGSGDYLCNYTQQAINSTNFGTGDFTIECWVYFNSTSGDQGIIDDASNPSSAGTQKWFLHKDGSGNLAFGQHSVGNILSYSWSPSTGTWYYITITRASGTAYMFINGSLVTSASNSTNFASSGGVQVGIFASGNSLNGYLDDVRITNGYARYTSTFTPPTSALPTY